MMEEGKYIYCIIKGIGDQSFGPIGINNRQVNLVHYKDMAAVVSSSPVINFDRLDKKELTRHITTHQKVNEEVMSANGGSASGGKEYDVVPMAFGIIAPSISEVLRILGGAYLQFKTALRKAAGKAEFAVQVWWDEKMVLEEIANTTPEIQKLKEEASSKRGVLAILIKLKLGKLIHTGVEAKRENYIKDIHTFLDSCSHDYTQNKLIDDNMIANLSFLIERAKETELDKKMQELGKKHEGRLRFKYIGPMPPYSFIKINLGLGNFELVREARKLLGLSEEASFSEIKKAYYDLAHKYHPDKYGGESETAEKMKKIAEAHRILESYCQSYEDFAGKKKDQKYSFKEEDVKNSIMIC